jgi:chromosome segregation ATPase
MRSRYELRINELDLVIKRYTQTTLQLDARILEFENEVRRLQDVEDQLRMARDYISSLEAQKDELQNELTTASAYIIELEEKYYKAQRTSLELLKQLKASEHSCDEM